MTRKIPASHSLITVCVVALALFAAPALATAAPQVSVSGQQGQSQDMSATLYVRGLSEADWSLVTPMAFDGQLFRGELTAAEISAYYQQGHDLLVYRVQLADEADNEISRPTLFEEHEQQFQIAILP